MNERILVAGETLLDFIPDAPGPLASVEAFTRRPGGAPANVAVGLAKLGAPPLFWTRIGTDPFGDFLVETLERAGIPDRFVERDPDAKTALAFVSHDEDADREFAFYREGTADVRLEPGGVPDDVLASVEAVYVGGVMLTGDPARSATLDLAERAREQDCTVWFDPNARPELWSAGGFPEAASRAFELADVVKATPADLRAAGVDRETPADLARAVTDGNPHTALLTLGDRGSYGLATGRSPWGPAEASHHGFDVDPVDATGAGDAFTAGAMASVVGGDEDLDDVLRFANAVAATTTTAAGAMAALPGRDAVSEFLAGREG